MQLQTKHKTTIKTTIGVILIAFGLMGLIFPILPGWWVILIGLQILGFKLVIDRKKHWTKVISLKEETSEKQFTIIQLKPNDWSEYRRIRLEMLQEEPQAFNSKFEEASAYPDEYWKDKLASKDDVFVFAKCEDKIVGVMNLTFREEGEPDSVAVVHGAYVNKNYRGLGIGSALLKFLINSVKNNNGISVLKLWLKESQTSARQLYEKEGFKFVERAGRHTLILEKHLK